MDGITDSMDMSLSKLWASSNGSVFLFVSFFLIYLFILLYNIVLVLPYIDLILWFCVFLYKRRTHHFPQNRLSSPKLPFF